MNVSPPDLGCVLIWPVTLASSRQWSRQDGGATTKLGQYRTLKLEAGGCIFELGRKLKTEILDTTESREAKMEIPDKTNRGEHE
jgi:hypothetical protein